ncbi:MAG: sigma-70 family RNA polymerase sigma factor [Clostridia bacterium]|nr:sigma-70 family RNA polymerase sigma factor [Clostridia bacterium]
MYILDRQEKALLVRIVKNARADFFRANKYIFVEETLEDKVISSNESIEEDYERKFDSKIQAEELENLFADIKVSKCIRALTYYEKSVLYFFYVENRTDEEIAQMMLSTSEAIRSKRRRVINKIRKEVDKNV